MDLMMKGYILKLFDVVKISQTIPNNKRFERKILFEKLQKCKRSAGFNDILQGKTNS